ncbi:Two component system response regulator, DNA-binding domain-containing [Desulfonema limicola]|uniref:Two component system response regulator, DNA-binding domain-containing n=1 Tax=Desulfonema limicola TaxID=45656 RepID=A0A975GI96_9BACT|nr:response regulator transcription factor [Desulfonema limicola]QTA81658.1 Two component system response regulator, DNA-binding domain-containing [Desulfonema limicola]
MKNSDKKRILVVEDEIHIAEGLKLNLTLQGYDVNIAGDGGAGIQLWKEWHPDLIVLDIMLPIIDGIAVLRNIRLEDEKIPILILSAKSADDDKIKGLSYGVDDYLAKPFNLDEFLLRIERLLKRADWYKENQVIDENSISNTTYTFGANHIDFTQSTAVCKSETIHLTEQEIRLLKLFIANKGKPLSRTKLLEIGWGYTRETTTRTVDNFIVRFRKYFEEDSKKPVFFKSLRSVGYMFDHK